MRRSFARSSRVAVYGSGASSTALLQAVCRASSAFWLARGERSAGTSVLSSAPDFMLTVLGPILAQVVSATIADRTEARYIGGVDSHTEAATSVQAGVAVGERHLTLALGYGPSFTLTPLGSEPRELTIFHNGSLVGAYRWRHTVVTLATGVGYGSQNFYVLALAGGAAGAPVTPNPPATADPGAMNPNGTAAPASGTPATGTATGTTGGTTPTQAANQPRAVNQVVRYVSARATLGVQHRLTATVSVGGGLGYSVSGAVATREQAQYPLVHGVQETGFVSVQPDRRDVLSATVSAQYSQTDTPPQLAGTPNTAWIFSSFGSWAHEVDRHTSASLSAGAAMGRTPLERSFVQYSIYPTFGAAITNSGYTLARGRVSFGFNASGAPVFDLATGVIDPRLGIGGRVGWGRDRFSIGLNASSSFSLTDPNAPGSYRTAAGGLGIAYALGKVVAIDGGVRGAWQTFQGQQTIPLSYGAYVGLTIGGQVALSH